MTCQKNNAKKKAAVTATAFGAALGTMYLAPNAAEAEVIDLTSAFAGVNAFSSVNSQGAAFKDFVPGTAGLDMFQWNDPIGKTFALYGDIQSYGVVNESEILTSDVNFYNTGNFVSYSATGTQYFGFRTTSGQLGWLSMNYGGAGGDITYLAAAYNDTKDGSIHVGTIPEPGSMALFGLGLLALGAPSMKRRKSA